MARAIQLSRFTRVWIVPHYTRRKWYFYRGLYRTFSVWKSSLTICWQKRVFIPPLGVIISKYFCPLLYAEKIALWQGPFSKKVEKFLARQNCPHYTRTNPGFYTPLGVMISKYFVPYHMRRKWRFGRGLGAIFCQKISLYYTLGKWRFDKPLLRIFFRNFFSPHYMLIKSLFINPLAEDFVQKICPSLYAGKNAFWQPPLNEIF